MKVSYLVALLALFLYLFRNRTFVIVNKWHRYLYRPDALPVTQPIVEQCQSTEGNAFVLSSLENMLWFD